VLEELDKQLDVLYKRYTQIGRLKVEIEEVTFDIDQGKPLLALEEQINTITDQQLKREDIGVKWQILSSILDDVYNIKIKLEQLDKWIKFEPSVISLIALTDKRDDLEMKLGDIASDVDELLSIDNRIFGAGNLIKVLQEQFDEEMGNTCLLCGQSIKKK